MNFSFFSCLIDFFSNLVTNPVRLIDVLAGSAFSWLPSTPVGYRMVDLISGLTGQSSFGHFILSEVWDGFIKFFAILVVIKIWKLIPFKAT